ncbi:MAG: Hsp20/alpha crystallin family protein [Candidatus Nomurabacteria bacterium]|nr:MAG: Hsp20/alpha crystallin family protein [Candidatus Nomurabacteria bacterium]
MARRKQVPTNDDSMLLEDDAFGAAFLDEELVLDGDQEPNMDEEPTDVAVVEEEVVELEEEDAQLAVDLYETEDKLILKARVAGVDKSDIDLELNEGVITISGVLSSNDSDEITQYHLQECYWGKFYRQVKFPVPVKEDEESIDAVLDEGVLILTFIKEKTDTAKKIKIS